MEDPPIIDYATPPKREGPGVDVPSVVSLSCAVAALGSCTLVDAFGPPVMGIGFLLGLVALLAGLLGLVRTTPRWSVRVSRTRGAGPGAGLAFFGTLGGVIVVGVLLLLPTMGRAREPAFRIKCGSNLRMIGQAIRQYGLDNEGAFPPDFDTLLAESDLVQEVFLCPSSETDIVAPPPLVVGHNCSYHYFGAGLTDAAPAIQVLATCNPVHHDGDGANVLFADGSERFLEPVELFEALADSAATAQ